MLRPAATTTYISTASISQQTFGRFLVEYCISYVPVTEKVHNVNRSYENEATHNEENIIFEFEMRITSKDDVISYFLLQ